MCRCSYTPEYIVLFYNNLVYVIEYFINYYKEKVYSCSITVSVSKMSRHVQEVTSWPLTVNRNDPC